MGFCNSGVFFVVLQNKFHLLRFRPIGFAAKNPERPLSWLPSRMHYELRPSLKPSENHPPRKNGSRLMSKLNLIFYLPTRANYFSPTLEKNPFFLFHFFPSSLLSSSSFDPIWRRIKFTSDSRTVHYFFSFRCYLMVYISRDNSKSSLTGMAYVLCMHILAYHNNFLSTIFEMCTFNVHTCIWRTSTCSVNNFGFLNCCY
jgi:hypothetical protein